MKNIISVLALSVLIYSCNKHNMGHMDMGMPVNVVEGNFNSLLPIPNEEGGNTTLTAQMTTANLNGGSFSVLGYKANSILGPTIRVNSNSTVNINFQNNLSEESNIHWHGLKIPSNMDGHPSNAINTGASFNYQFNVDQRAGLNWYHPHIHMLTGKQVYKGLSGLFIVNDAEESALNLPSGNLEIPLIIQDKRLSITGLNYNPSMSEMMSGYMGESILVNGVKSPYTEVATRFYRLRILNGSNARIYNLKMSDNSSFTIIGNDGGLLSAPETVNSVMLAPAERLDILVNFTNTTLGSEVFLESTTFANGGDAQGQQSFKILKFKVTQEFEDNFVIPSTLSFIPALSAATNTRNFALTEMEMSGEHSMSGMHRINDKIFDINRIDETISPNTTEFWIFENKGNEPHPIHLHGVHFQIVERTGGRPIIPSEKGWKDVVLIMPGEKVKLIIPFGSYSGKFVFHCHNLEHEDDGMMLQYLIQ